MPEQMAQMRWANAEWLEEVHAWIERHAAGLNREITGAIAQPRVRPWATAMRVPTDRGDLWFKATAPSLPTTRSSTIRRRRTRPAGPQRSRSASYQ